MSGIKNWDTSKVTNMERMLFGASNFKNDLSGWEVEQIGERPDGFADGVPEDQIVEPLWKKSIPDGPLLGIIQCLNKDGSYLEVKVQKGVTVIPDTVVEILNWGYITDEYLNSLSGEI